MRGFIRRRGDAWELRVYLGQDAVTGKKRHATLDAWHTWATGRPIPPTELAAATATIAAAARHARPWARHADELDHDRYHQLLLPVIADHPELEATIHRPSAGIER